MRPDTVGARCGPDTASLQPEAAAVQLEAAAVQLG
jgi:hypothetical protein